MNYIDSTDIKHRALHFWEKNVTVFHSKRI